jgi:Tfp pilus tip-associated adhesin PilY1
MPEISISQKARVAATLVLLAALATLPAAGDDRQTLRNSAGNPYVFILLDTSGSMNWAPPCTATDFANGVCSPLCATSDCYVPLMADDPNSKLYQAKQAITSVLQSLNSVHFGFGTYNQDALSLRAKHYMYQATTAGPTLTATYGPYPAIGAQEVFGYTGAGTVWACASGTGDNLAGCGPTTPADLTQIYQANRIKFLPKGDANFASAQTIYVKSVGSTYRIIYTPAGGTVPGAATINVSVNIVKCTNANCTTTSGSVTQTVSWSLVHDFVAWDVGGGGNPNETNPSISYFAQTQAADAQPTNTCSGWDPNTDSAADTNTVPAYSIRQPTNSSDPRGTFFTVGDVVPWDWTNDHNLDVRKRLAPNLELTPGGTPDFTIASYFNNLPWTGQSYLRIPTGNVLDSGTAKSIHAPLIAGGATPIGASLLSFRNWFSGCGTKGTPCPANAGWKAVAAAKPTGDPLYTCSRKYVLFISDGDETCNTTASDSAYPCTVAGDLNKLDSVFTYMLGFGVAANPGNILNCVASQGGTNTPIYPQNKAQLISALTDIFGSIAENPSAFASAAVPSVQASTSDKVYLTSFFPLDDQGIWDGHVNAFLKPLPTTSTGVPDLSIACSASITSSCLLWDAGKVLLTQAPTLAQATGGNYQIGNSTTQRRVIYPYVNTNIDIPSQVRTFTPPAGNAPSSDWLDLFQGMGLVVDATHTAAQDQAAATAVIRNTLSIKTANVSFTDGSGNTSSFSEQYVLGDTFHSDPIFYSNPNNFIYYAADLYGNGATCTNKPSDNPGYRCYADRHQERRKLLMVGANDGQLHAFDAGTWDSTKKLFSDGTGGEVFSYIPRLVLPILRDQAAPSNVIQIFSVDGTARIDDVFIDPHHTAAAGPLATKREWRTVLIGGLREGGKANGGGQTSGFVSGYYALDITDPDPLDTNNNPTTTGLAAGCTDTANLNSANATCGTNPFPTALWEFTDSIAGSRLDEDGNGAADLASTWSVPTIGRIQVTDPATGKVVQKSVAIFGGGFDPANKLSPLSGTWIYIVDIETGKAIYKAAVSGAVVGDPAVVDTNLDGLLDTIYFGTTAGYLYKMDISTPATLADYTLNANTSNAIPKFATAQTVKRVTDTAWAPFKIFDTGGLPIYLSPTTFFVSDLNQFAIAFGTGDREDLWNFVVNSSNQQVAYTFNLIIDEGYTSKTGGLPKTANKYANISSIGAAAAAGTDNVLAPSGGNNRGWVLNLQTEERVVTKAFGLGGTIIFSTYTPDALQPDSTGKCSFHGDSHNFVVFANNANPIASVNGTLTRYTVVTDALVTNPYVEPGATKNPPVKGASAPTPVNDAARLQGIEDTLALQFCPKTSRIGHYWWDVKTVDQNTKLTWIARVPICITIKNWKEY